MSAMRRRLVARDDLARTPRVIREQWNGEPWWANTTLAIAAVATAAGAAIALGWLFLKLR